MASPTGNPYAAIFKLFIDEGLFEPTVAYADVSACTLFFWDYLLTLDMEIRLVWKSQWNTVKVVYLMQRYMPFIDACYLTLYRQMAFHLTVHECVDYSYVTAFMYTTGILLSELLLTSRVWAIWNREKRLGIALFSSMCTLFGGAYYATYSYVKGLKYIESPFPEFNFQGCFIIGANDAIIWCWAVLMAWSCITLTLMLIPGIRAYKLGVSSKLTTVIYRDGVYYYIYLFILSSINIVCASTLPGQKRVMVTLLERNLHSIIASRVLLHMRDQIAKPAQTHTYNASLSRTEFGAAKSFPIDIENVQLSPAHVADGVLTQVFAV